MPPEFKTPHPPESPTPSPKFKLGSSDWRNAVIIGSIIGGVIIIGFALNRKPQEVNISSTSISKEHQSAKTSPSEIGLDTKVKTSLSPNTSVTTNNISRPSAEKVVEDYYNKISNRQYRDAWNILPIQLQKNTKLHPDGYDSFLKWYRDSIDFVNIQNISLAESNNNLATVNFEGIYHMKSRRKAQINLKFYMAWNEDNQRWYINKIKIDN